MQRSTTLLEHLLTSDLSTVQTAGDLNLDTLGTSTHRVLDSHLDGTAISHEVLDLAGDVLTDDRGIELRTLNLEDVDLDILLVELLQLLLQFVDILTTLTDDDTRTGCANSDGDEFESTLDDDA